MQSECFQSAVVEGKPALQWWDRSARHALIVSVRAPGANIDIYTAIANKLEFRSRLHQSAQQEFFLCRRFIFLVLASGDNHQRVIGQRTLQRLGFIPGPARIQTSRSSSVVRITGGFRMDRLDDSVRRGRPGIVLDLVPRSPLNSVQAPAKPF